MTFMNAPNTKEAPPLTFGHSRWNYDVRSADLDTQTIGRCDQLIGSSPRMLAVYELVRRVADLPAYVLITGESGTGKELVARAIHTLGNRSQQPFVAVSCGAIPETLIEAELFGHEKGAFTGSQNARIGLLEAAGNGTLFLDEIGELSLQTQVKLLRVLQQREFSRLGSNRTIPLRARVVFATHQNLREMVDAGTFREDLYFRINVVRIPVPALRDRTEDVPALAQHILQKYAAEYGMPTPAVLPDAMALLMAYDWPGNVRELENTIQRTLIMANGSVIGVAELPETLKDASRESEEVEGIVGGGTFDEMLRAFKIRLVRNAVQKNNGNKSLAAKELQVSRAYLHRLIRTGPQLVNVA
jgi:transcriptional regulator with PAS, ATPase and Fis domain